MDGEQKIIVMLEKILDRLECIKSDTNYIEANLDEILKTIHK